MKQLGKSRGMESTMVNYTAPWSAAACRLFSYIYHHLPRTKASDARAAALSSSLRFLSGQRRSEGALFPAQQQDSGRDVGCHTDLPILCNQGEMTRIGNLDR